MVLVIIVKGRLAKGSTSIDPYQVFDSYTNWLLNLITDVINENILCCYWYILTPCGTRVLYANNILVIFWKLFRIELSYLHHCVVITVFPMVFVFQDVKELDFLVITRYIHKGTLTVLFHDGHNPSHDMLEVNGFYLDHKKIYMWTFYFKWSSDPLIHFDLLIGIWCFRSMHFCSKIKLISWPISIIVTHNITS